MRCVRPQGAVTEPGVPSLARRLYPKAGPVIVRAADGTRLHTEVFGHEESYPTAGFPALARRGRPPPRSPATCPDTSVDFNAEARQFAVQRRTGDTEGCCGPHTVPAGLTQCQDDRISLD